MTRVWRWLFEHVPLGPLAPYVLALAMGRAAHDIQKEEAKLAMKGILLLILSIAIAFLYFSR